MPRSWGGVSARTAPCWTQACLGGCLTLGRTFYGQTQMAPCPLLGHGKWGGMGPVAGPPVLRPSRAVLLPPPVLQGHLYSLRRPDVFHTTPVCVSLVLAQFPWLWSEPHLEDERSVNTNHSPLRLVEWGPQTYCLSGEALPRPPPLRAFCLWPQCTPAQGWGGRGDEGGEGHSEGILDGRASSRAEVEGHCQGVSAGAPGQSLRTPGAVTGQGILGPLWGVG